MKHQNQKYKLTVELDVVVNDTVLMLSEEELEDYYDECSDYISEAILSVIDAKNMNIVFDNDNGSEVAHCTIYCYSSDPILTRESIGDILVELEDYEYRGVIKSVSY